MPRNKQNAPFIWKWLKCSSSFVFREIATDALAADFLKTTSRARNIAISVSLDGFVTALVSFSGKP